MRHIVSQVLPTDKHGRDNPACKDPGIDSCLERESNVERLKAWDRQHAGLTRHTSDSISGNKNSEIASMTHLEVRAGEQIIRVE